jgi:hypothetical protein
MARGYAGSLGSPIIGSDTDLLEVLRPLQEMSAKIVQPLPKEGWDPTQPVPVPTDGAGAVDVLGTYNSLRGWTRQFATRAGIDDSQITQRWGQHLAAAEAADRGGKVKEKCAALERYLAAVGTENSFTDDDKSVLLQQAHGLLYTFPEPAR